MDDCAGVNQHNSKVGNLVWILTFSETWWLGPDDLPLSANSATVALIVLENADVGRDDLEQVKLFQYSEFISWIDQAKASNLLTRGKDVICQAFTIEVRAHPSVAALCALQNTESKKPARDFDLNVAYVPSDEDDLDNNRHDGYDANMPSPIMDTGQNSTNPSLYTINDIPKVGDSSNGAKLYTFEGDNTSVYLYVISTSSEGQIKSWLCDNNGPRIEYDTPPNISSTTFNEQLPMIDFISQLLNRDVTSRTLSDADRMKIKKALKGAKVEVTQRGSMRRKYTISGLTPQARRELTFSIAERGTVKTVVDYFQQTYGLIVQHTQLTCLQVGNIQRGNYLPMEERKRVEGQRYSKRLNERQITQLLHVTCQRPTKECKTYFRMYAITQMANPKEFGIKISDQLAVKYWDMDNVNMVTSIIINGLPVCPCVCSSDEGKLVAVSTNDNKVHMLTNNLRLLGSLGGQTASKIDAHVGNINDLAFSHSWLAC